ncbi:MAG: hypothetical protein GY832_01195 [Chloroflexi bacterium]|nr:hypothetical protein [Chloroflexota bacterium]
MNTREKLATLEKPGTETKNLIDQATAVIERAENAVERWSHIKGALHAIDTASRQQIGKIRRQRWRLVNLYILNRQIRYLQITRVRNKVHLLVLRVRLYVSLGWRITILQFKLITWSIVQIVQRAVIRVWRPMRALFIRVWQYILGKDLDDQ